MRKPAPVFLFVFLCVSVQLYAQFQEIAFQRIGLSEGLSQSFVHCLLKAEDGFVWAGTQDGLNRFDAYQFENFYKEAGNPASLSNNYIWDLYQDRQSNIWIGTNGAGLCQYIPSLNRFNNFLPTQNAEVAKAANIVRTIIETTAGNVLVGTDDGLYHLNLTTQKFEKIRLKEKSKDYAKSIYSFLRLDEDYILVGSLENILLYRESSQGLEILQLGKEIKGGIHSLVKLKDGTIWAGTGKGLFQMNYQAEADSLSVLKHYTSDLKMDHPISSNFISALLADEQAGLWIASNKGLNYFNTQHPENGFQVYQHHPLLKQSISNDLVYDLLEVEPGIIWAATQDGINQFSTKPALIKNLYLEAAQQSNCGISVHGMEEDERGDLLVCTEKGLLHINAEDKSVSCFDKVHFPAMEEEFLVSISPGQQQDFWIAQRRAGFAQLIYDNGQYRWKGYKLPAGAYRNIGTNDLIEEADGSLWIASSGLGLWKLDQKTGNYESFQKNAKDSTALSGNYIFQLLKDQASNIWLALADGGLCRMDKQRQQFSCFTHDPADPNSLSSNMVISVFEDSRQRIWACTADGLNVLTKDEKFIRLTKEDGLPNNLIYGMLEDEEQRLWISTDQGIACLEYGEELQSIKTYTTQDGLIAKEFNQHAFYKNRQAVLIFGSKGGLNFINPKELKTYDIAPQLILTDFKLFNESVEIAADSTKTFALDRHINSLDKINLPYDQNFIAFEFTGINFENASKTQYAYQIEGLDPDWVYCGDRRYASYPGLESGDYLFKLKAANHDGIWSNSVKSVLVHIETAPWKTWWAYVLYSLCLFGIVYAIFQYRLYSLQAIERAKEEERSLFRKRAARDFHDEAGNQITKISLMTELAKRKTNTSSDMNQLLVDIEDKVQALRSGMRDFIWVLDPDNDNLYDTLLRLKEFGNSFFEYASIHFKTEGIEEDLLELNMSGNYRRHLLMIFKEAIHNSLKYSQAKEVVFKLIRQGDQIELLLIDDGQGFDLETSQQGQGLRNIRSRAEKIAVDCDIISEKDKGTTIRIRFNITQMGN